jgi:BMFP domain-containing protein YqiC
MSESLIPNQSQSSPDGSSETPQKDSGSNPLQERFDMLTRKAAEAARQAVSEKSENAKLSQKIAALEERLAAMSAPKADTFSDGQRPSASAPANPSDIAAMVQRAVSEAIQADRVVTSRRTEQMRAFEAAARDVPALRDANSEAFKMFEQLWDSNPHFQEMPNGPVFVAHTVRSLLSDAKAPANRQHASSPLPIGARDRLGSSIAAPQADAIVAKVVEKGSQYELGSDELGALIQAKEGQYDARRQGK